MHFENVSAHEIKKGIDQKCDEFKKEGHEKSGTDLDPEKEQDKENEKTVKREDRSHAENKSARHTGRKRNGSGVRVQ
jgi:hypothetical protein